MTLPGGPPPPEPSSPPETGPTPSARAAPPDIIPGVFPAGQVHLFSGASGAGKTAIGADFVARLATSRPVLGDFFIGRPPAFIGFIAADRTWADHLQWFEIVGLPSIPHYSLIDDQEITGKKIRSRKSDRFDLFQSCVEKLCEGPPPYDALIVVDPISLFLGGNLIDYDRVYSYMVDLSQYCIKHQFTIFGMCHTSKQKGDPKQRYARPQDRINGTTAQTGCAGTVFHLAPPSETDHPWHEFTWVPHHAPAETVHLQRNQDGLFENYQLTEDDQKLEVAEQTYGKGKRAEKLALAHDQLPPDGSQIAIPELVEKIRAALPCGRATAYRYVTALLHSKEIVDLGQGMVRRRTKN